MALKTMLATRSTVSLFMGKPEAGLARPEAISGVLELMSQMAMSNGLRAALGVEQVQRSESNPGSSL